MSTAAPPDAFTLALGIIRRERGWEPDEPEPVEEWRAHPGTLAEHLDPRHWTRFPHTEHLCAKFVEAAETPGTRQIWNLPPRHAKSETASHRGPVWFLDRHPERRIILASYAAELAQNFGRQVRNTIDANSDQLRVRLAPDSRAAHRWNTPDGGGMLTAGVGGLMTGFGANLFVIDDPFANWQEAHSATVQERVWNWWLSTARTRLEPGASAILVMTRWHEDDLAGRLVAQDRTGDGEGWDVVNLPALAEPTRAEREAMDDETRAAWRDAIGRREGEALNPERYPRDELLKTMRAIGSYLAAGMYQQRPSPDEGGILKRGWWRWYTTRPYEFDEVLTSWDMAFKDAATSSFVVGQVWGRRGADKYLLDQVRDRMDFPTTKREVAELARKWPKASVHLVEDKANGPAIISELRHVLAGLIPVPVAGSKEARAHAVSGQVESGNVYLPDPQLATFPIGEFVDEAASFPNGRHDDQVDAFTQALARMSGEVGEVQTSWDHHAGLAGRR